MRAGVPVLSAGSRMKKRRRKSPVVPVLLLPDLELWFRSSSRVEILQRVIDYILQLQTELQEPTCTAASFSLAGVRNEADRTPPEFICRKLLFWQLGGLGRSSTSSPDFTV
ncbi:uncharacterized protein LOC119476560 isoform X2 [Sebastes umbrosus]|uniref:uncharacterized protein LOC119476560 isoform X2 n=1 Tax=Sebastes umbrosus TaxID=72105 RepID=UPI0018A0CF45|nr:uncharacterized protein LOC119476560 isoform X2 [Sebastes umbrosus]